jgi:Tfp pilus assembly protein PilF
MPTHFVNRSCVFALIVCLPLAADVILPKGRQVDPEVARAVSMINRGEVAGAASLLEPLVDRNPKSASAVAALAEVRMRQHRPDEAARLFETAVQLQPKNPDLLLSYARLLISRNQIAEAERRLKQAGENSTSVGPLVSLGEFYIGTNRPQGSVATFRRAVELDQHSIEAKLGLATALSRMGQGTQAEQVLQSAVKLSPTAPAPYLLLGAIYSEQKQFDKALAAYGKALEVDPKNRAAYLMRGDLFAGRNQVQAALGDYRKALAAGGDSAVIRIRAAMAAQTLGDKSGAEKDYRAAIALDKNSAVAYNNLANLLMADSSRLAEAASLASTAARLQPAQIAFQDTLASVKEAQGDIAGAIQILEQALAKGAGSPETFYHLGVLRGKGGDRQKELVALRRALQMSATFPGADDARRRLQGKP